MLNPIKKLLGRIVAVPQDAPPQDLDAVLRLASAVLIAEVVRSDLEVDAREREVMRAALRDKFDLPAEDVQALVEHAEQTARDSNDLFTFTSQVNAQFAMPQKLQLLEFLWRVAYANGTIDDHERHIVRRIADLMHVPQGASMGIRQRVAQESGAARP